MSAEDDDRTRIQPRTVRPDAPAESAPPVVNDGNGLPIGTVLGEFEITALLGEGGFGIVYLATDHSLRRSVALKEYMPSALAARAGASQVKVKSERHRETFEAGLKSFVNEAHLLAQFDHPALVKVYRFWEANGTAYMVMPYYEGITLKDLLRTLREPPDETWLRELLTPLTQALAVIHAEQCFHRDIAPDNVMMLGGNHKRPLLLDFGAARRVIGDMTQVLTVILKPGFAPVEQYAEIPGMKQGPWTDVYALAAVVYFAITGKTPPPAVGRLLNDTYEPLVQVAGGRYSERFLAAIDRALAVRPEERTSSIAALSADLGLGQALFDVDSTRPIPLDAAEGIPAPPLPPPKPAPAALAPVAPMAAAKVDPVRKRFSQWMWGGIAVLGLVVLLALMLKLKQEDEAGRLIVEPPRQPASGVGELVTPPPPVTLPSTAEFDVPTEFASVVRAGAAEFGVGIQAVKPVLRIGHDELAFSMQSARAGFLYVLAHSSDGSLTQIYPNTQSGAVRVDAGKTMRLPQRPIVFEVTEPPGPIWLLAIVSAQQRNFGEFEPRAEGAFLVFPTGAAAAHIVAAHTGSAPLLAGQAVCRANRPCDATYGAALVKVDTVR